MDEISVADLINMLLDEDQGAYQVHVDIIKSIFEKEYESIVSLFTVISGIGSGIVIALLTSPFFTSQYLMEILICWILPIVLIIFIPALIRIYYMLQESKRKYLKIFRTYNYLKLLLR
jgi:hypothetical protein